jgi:hypothetical protein
VSDSKLPALRRQDAAGRKRLRRLVPISTIAAAAVAFALVGGYSGSPTASGSTAKTAVADYVSIGSGRLTVDSAAAEKAGVDSRALSAERAIVADLNKALASEKSTVGSGDAALEKVSVDDKAQAASAADSQSTTITIVDGFTITVSGSGIVVYISKADVTEFESVAGFAKDVLAYLGSAAVAAAIASAILAAVPGIGLSAVAAAGVVSAVVAFLGFGVSVTTDVLKICTAADGSATFTLPLSSDFPYIGVPTCSAQ